VEYQYVKTFAHEYIESTTPLDSIWRAINKMTFCEMGFTIHANKHAENTLETYTV
jgi:hypothetical protein